MKGKRLFVQWALFAALLVVGAVMAGQLGWIGYLEKDPTHITYVTLGVFGIATAWCGWLCWKLSSGGDPEHVKDELDHGWFASSLCVSIGLIGTAVGYYMMLKNGNAGGEPSEVIRQAFANTSIAIINTVCGAICGVVIEIQSHFIGHAVKLALRKSAAPAPPAPPDPPAPPVQP